MILYHGSNIKITKPDFAYAKPYKDFGKGFYLSDNEQQAWDLAHQKVEQSHTGIAEVSCFQFDENILTSADLNVKIVEDYSTQWAEFILKNRNTKLNHPQHNFDIVYGPIADDGVALQLKRYHGGVLSIEQLVEELKYAKGITFQYFFGTEKALQTLIAL